MWKNQLSFTIAIPSRKGKLKIDICSSIKEQNVKDKPSKDAQHLLAEIYKIILTEIKNLHKCKAEASPCPRQFHI